MESKITLGEKEYTYHGLLEREVRKYQQYLKQGNSYRPFKYY